VSDFDVVSSRTVYTGKIMSLRVDEIRMPGGGVATREVVEHGGAVGVVALDDDGAVVMIRQYRHPARARLLELPAGLLDVPGEKAVDTARRELAEETHLRASTWHTLADIRSSPGLSEEAARIFLARGLSDVAEADRHVGVEEETDLGVHRRPLDDAVAAVLAGEIENSLACVGILAAARARDLDWAPLRAPDAPWPARPTH
jgi:ADP-ribose pyrophosphatase